MAPKPSKSLVDLRAAQAASPRDVRGFGPAPEGAPHGQGFAVAAALSSGAALARRAKAALDPGSSLHELALEVAPSGLVVCDEAGTILLANRKLEDLFGHPAAELLGRSIDLILPIDVRSSLAAERVGRGGDLEASPPSRRRSTLGRRRDGTPIAVEVELTWEVCDGQRLIVASVIDVRERIEAERRERETLAERLAFERLISELAARFVNIPPERVDDTIVDSLRQIIEALGLDRGALWQFTDDDSDLVYTHIWVHPECSPPPSQVSSREMFPWHESMVRAGKAVWNIRPEDVPNAVDRDSLRRMESKSSAVIPLILEGRAIGAVSFGAMRREHSWSPEVRERLSLIATVFAHALARQRNQKRLHKALTEVERLRRRLARENVQLRQEASTPATARPVAAQSRAVQAVLEQIYSVAPTGATVLLTGETGVGKEVFARVLHDLSDRRGRPMVWVNCAAIPAALIESELFGRERGAYTGALSRQIGRFELAQGTTLFLDEIGELPLESQAKLLRAVQDRVIERLGGGRPVHVDVRLVAATNRDLGSAVADRTFREDLFYRLNVFPIRIPPLRERLEDIPSLAWTFVEEFSTACGKHIESISKHSLEALQRHTWPGNVRELRNLIERAVILATGPSLSIDPPSIPPASTPGTTLAAVEVAHIRETLERANWRVRGRGGAAERLGMKATTLDSRMAKLGIRRPTA